MPQSDPDDVRSAETTLNIASSFDRRLDVLQPALRGRRSATYEMMLENRGNTQASCRLHLVDQPARLAHAQRHRRREHQRTAGTHRRDEARLPELFPARGGGYIEQQRRQRQPDHETAELVRRRLAQAAAAATDVAGQDEAEDGQDDVDDGGHASDSRGVESSVRVSIYTVQFHILL